ncbi:ATP synthase subunit C lysine N-methyltransferase isoform X2 [Tachypleus tridentatus]|uniref:ATP synthase subunit C lysine N-methyltransferase isoform X2 n=1 Tax=Tachypleus tridentatus TaxID=6853 RepID=UPI003FCFF342
MEKIVEENNISSQKQWNTIGLITGCITGAVGVGLMVLSGPFITPALRRICLPYVPATTKQVTNVMTALRLYCVKEGTVVDLGSGDGRIVIEAAKQGYTAHGVELNLWLILYSRFKALVSGVSQKTSFKRQNLWKMHKLGVKAKHEMENGSYLIACRYPLPRWNPKYVINDGIDSVWVYKIEQILNHNISV